MQFPNLPKWQNLRSPILLAALSPFAAKALLTVSDSGVSADGQMNIDTPGAIMIGTASSTGITIGNGSETVSFPGNVAIGSTVPIVALETPTETGQTGLQIGLPEPALPPENGPSNSLSMVNNAPLDGSASSIRDVFLGYALRRCDGEVKVSLNQI